MSGFQFHTAVAMPKFEWQTGYSQKHVFMGSCFTENVGNKMAALKFDVDINPFGILYNPVSVAAGLRILLQSKEFSKTDLVGHNGLYHSFSHHGKFSSPNEKDTLLTINSRVKSSSEYLRSANFLFITFGTAWVYTLKSTGQAVANCHKIPAAEFERSRLSVAEIVAEYTGLITEIRKFNPGVKVVFTVSPIRHWKDGAIENQRSKATLLLAIAEIVGALGSSICNYFPSYEIMMDELRDYRFYAADMLHISDVAVNHIWGKFVETIIDNNSRQIVPEVEKIIKAKNHKASGKNLREHQKFLQKMLEQAIAIENRFKQVNLREEQSYFSDKLNDLS